MAKYQPGDPVSFEADGHNGQGRRRYVGHVERNPAQGFVGNGWKDIPGTVSVLFFTRPGGAAAREFLPESALTPAR